MKGMKKNKSYNRIITFILSITLLLSMAASVCSDATFATTQAQERRAISSTSRKPKKLDINLRNMIGEKRSGYSVVQGSVTDGAYAYYLMVSSYNQNGRVLKTRISDNKVIAKSKIIDINHGNGMALDTRRNRLVIVGRGNERNQLTLVNVGNDETYIPQIAGYAKVNYKYSSNWTKAKKTFDGYGLSAISYIEKYDCYLALQRSTHDILILDSKFNVIGFITTKVTAKYPGTYQAIDADDRYVYFVLSPYNRKQPRNIILVLDWHGEQMRDYVNGRTPVLKKSWRCGTDGSPSAVIRTNTPYEAESMYHVDQNDGTADFYLSEYHKNPKYKTVIKRRAYKVKWKKVKKRVKWKKVKVKGKLKWKYKTKNVWKYKKKYKYVKVRVIDYNRRDNYVYYLGKF